MAQACILFITTLVATGLSAMSGGGASIINIPVMLSLGISFPLATATQKISSMFWVLPASANYLRGRKVDWKFIILFSLIGLAGAYAGALVVIAINRRVAGIIIGILILSLVLYVLLKKDAGLAETKVDSTFRQIIACLGALILGFYESFFGAGNAILFSILTFHAKGFDFIDALGYFYSIAFLWEVLAVVVFLGKGYHSFAVMAPAIAGSVIGGHLGSRYARHKGNKFIKAMFASIGAVLGLKLLCGF
jgi:uncharacterized protein